MTEVSEVCGTAGILGASKSSAEKLVGALNDAQQHRGPDQSAVTRIGAKLLLRSPEIVHG
jgi:asparagine synthetase B (glutamine-hydrolysing)